MISYYIIFALVCNLQVTCFIVTRLKTSFLDIPLNLGNGNDNFNNQRKESLNDRSQSLNDRFMTHNRESRNGRDSIVSTIQNILKFGSVLFVQNSFASSDVPIYKNPKGAFEMDIDFYFRNILGTQSNEKVNEKRRLVYRSPRLISKTAAENIFDIMCNLVSSESNKTSKLDILNQVFKLVPVSLSQFQTYLPIVNRDFSDQYYFDISLFALWTIAVSMIPNSVNRVHLRSQIGESILKYILNSTDGSTELDYVRNPVSTTNLTVTCKGITLLLRYFVGLGFISSFKFDEDDASDSDFAAASFSQVQNVSGHSEIITISSQFRVCP